MSSLFGRLRTVLATSAGIAVAMAVMNIGAYAFQMVAARLLGPVPYGAIAAVMNVLLIVGVVQLGLQATAARRIASDPTHVAQIHRGIMRVSYRIAWVLGAVMLALAPVLDRALRLDSLPTAVMLALAAVPLTVMGAQAGILQGERRWLPLSFLYLSVGVARVLFGVLFLWLSPTEFAGMAAVTISLTVPVAIGWWALRHGREPGARHSDHQGRALLRETAHNSQALLAFFVLANMDVLLARSILDEHDAGLYAAGLILAKAVLFLPQFVIVLVFPTMAKQPETDRALWASLGVVGAIGVVAMGASVVLSGFAMVFVGGAEYLEVESDLWVFALLGTLMAMLQLLVYAVLARQSRGTVWLVWAAVVAAAATSMTVVTSRQDLVTAFIAIDAVLLVVLVAAALRTHRSVREPGTSLRTVEPPA